jgi:hypothetical protein
MTDHERHNPSPRADVARLVSAMIDETISHDERRQLLEKLRSEPRARQTYLELVELDSLLQWDSASISLPAADAPTATPRSLLPAVEPARQVTMLRWSLAATVLLCVTLAALLGVQAAAARAVADTTVRSSEGGPVAMITELRNAVWAPESPRPVAYQPLVPGWLNLHSGSAALDFLAGAKAVLEGPGELGLNASDRGVLRSGKLSVMTGRRGGPFHVSAPLLVARARNAEFALDVHDSGSVELHVFSGSVAATWTPPGEEPQTIDIGPDQALAVERQEDRIVWREVTADRARFTPAAATAIGPPVGDIKAVSFAPRSVLPYGYQDGQFGLPSHLEILDSGRTLHLSGNAWKMVEVDAHITPDTVIEFEFRSPREGQIHGFGLDNDDTYGSTEPIFQIYGYEARRDIGQQFNDYSGSEWRLYRVPVGRYLTGPRRYLYFAADEDVTAEAESFFRNVRIYRTQSR